MKKYSMLIIIPIIVAFIGCSNGENESSASASYNNDSMDVNVGIDSTTMATPDTIVVAPNWRKYAGQVMSGAYLCLCVALLHTCASKSQRRLRRYAHQNG